MAERNLLTDLMGYRSHQIPNGDLMAERGNVLPIGRDIYGGAHWAVPNLLLSPWNALWQAGDAASNGDWQGAGYAGAEAASAAMTSSMAFARPMESLGMGGRPINYFAQKEFYPGQGLNPLHPVHDWQKVRRLVRDARRGDDINPILYDGIPNNGNLLAGTHRSAANHIMAQSKKGGPQISRVALDDVVEDPSAYGLSNSQSQSLRRAVENGEYDVVDDIWDRRFDKR